MYTNRAIGSQSSCIRSMTGSPPNTAILDLVILGYRDSKDSVVQACCLYFRVVYRLFSHPLDKNIPFYRCLRFFYSGLLAQPRL